jgi:UDP-N-acetylglucosamine:LPS N-acetylglucosamine transferase
MGQVVLAVSSSGGHWEQLMILRAGFEDQEVFYVTTKAGLAERNGINQYFVVKDCNRDTPLDVFRTICALFCIIRKTRPSVVITTGAAPGLLAIFIGRIFGAKTIWVDSIANSERLSLSGKIAGYVSHLQITQWSHLSSENGPVYAGSIL